MQQALQGRKGFPAFVEVMIALGVFLVSSIAMSIGMLPIMVVYFMSDDKFVELAQSAMSGNMDDTQYYQTIQKLATSIPDWMMILTLVLELFMIAVVFLYCRVIEKRKLNTLGFRRKGMMKGYLAGALGGVLFFSVAYLFCVVTGSIQIQGIAKHISGWYILGYLAGYMVQGMAEEVLCRGYLFVSLSRRYSVLYSAVLSAVFFALLHGANSGLSALAVINLFLFGLFAAFLLVRYENIWIVGAFHSLWNFVQGNLYGIQVSGNSLQPSLLVSKSKGSMAILNGGSFGLEGGLGVTIVLTVGIIWLWRSMKKQGKIVVSQQAMSSGYENEMPQQNMPNGYGHEMPQQNMPNGYGNEMPQQNMPNGYGNETPQQNMPNGYDNGTAAHDQTNTAMPGQNRFAGGFPVEEQYWSQTPGNEQQTAKSYQGENMGVSEGETPWRPQQEQETEEEVRFDANYFKD